MKSNDDLKEAKMASASTWLSTSSILTPPDPSVAPVPSDTRVEERFNDLGVRVKRSLMAHSTYLQARGHVMWSASAVAARVEWIGWSIGLKRGAAARQ